MFGFGGYRVLYITDTDIVNASQVKRLGRFLTFSVRGQKKIALISSKAKRYRRKQSYTIAETDQNTFNASDNEILDKELEKDFKLYLKDNPEQCYFTKDVKPDDMQPHHIIEDIERTMVDGFILKNILQNVKGNMKGDFLYPFLAGIGAGIFLLVVVGAMSPETVSIAIGGKANV